MSWFKPMSPQDPYDPLVGLNDIKPPASREERREKELKRKWSYFHGEQVRYNKGDRNERINVFRG